MDGLPANLSAESSKSGHPAPVFEWETRSISQEISVSAESVEAWFFLTNPGPETRKILKIESDCDCITAALDRKQLHPGESAVLVATFHPGTRVGSVAKPIRVISRGKAKQASTDHLLWKLEIQPPVKWQRVGNGGEDSLRHYRIESRLTPPPKLKVPEALSRLLRLEQTEPNRWLLTADLSQQAQAADPLPLYLIAILPDDLRKHVPVPATAD